MFLINLDYKCDITEVERHTVSHRAWLDEKYSEGKLMFSGPKKPRTGGVIIAKVENMEQAEALVAEDPFYKNNIAEYTITEFLAMKAHPELKQFIEN